MTGDNKVALHVLLSVFVLYVLAILFFIWSVAQEQGSFIENGNVIFFFCVGIVMTLPRGFPNGDAG